MSGEAGSARVGNAEREAAQRALHEHLNAGRLGIQEYSERSAVAANATSAGELANLFVDLPPPHPPLPGIPTKHGPGRTALVVTAAAVLLVVGVVVAVSVSRTGSATPTGPPAAPASALPATPDVSVDPTTPSSGITTTTDDAPTSPIPSGGTYLSQLTAIDHSRYGSIDGDAATANGAFYGHSVIFYQRCENGEGGDIWAEYNLSRAYTKFATTVGISDQDPSSAQGSYRVLVDGVEVTKGDVSSGTSKHIELNVTGALHIRLQITNKTAAGDCTDKSVPVHTVWGNALAS